MTVSLSAKMWKVILLSVALTACFCSSKNVRKHSTWWDHSVIYQIYPRSFKDSDADGIGDLKGITSKLEHVREIADTVWLSPIYPSPQRDFGYDISDYKNVNPEYGTLEDFDEFIVKAKSLGLRVLMDFVPNHSSDEHEWFKKSIKRIPPYDDYYIWSDGQVLRNGTRAPPNNWLSVFSGSAWEWNKERGQYFYHKYAAQQPDLNYHNKLVQQEMKDVIIFWLDRGIDGFRVDTIATLFEDYLLRDEPRSNKAVPPTDTDYLLHIYTSNLDETYEVVRSWRKLMNGYSITHGHDSKLLLMEVATDLSYVMKYYEVGTDPMNLNFIHQLNNDSTAEDFRDNIKNWINFMPKNKIANWVVGNHDMSRTASRFGYNSNRADQMSMLTAVLPGMMIVYNGDEIGMTDRFFTYEETVDPAGCNAGPERYQLKSRDPERTPYQWDSTLSAGFSSSPKTWLPVNENYKTLNLEAQQNEEISHYKVFKALSKLREIPTVMRGSYHVYALQNEVLAVVRQAPMWVPVALFINFKDEDVILDARGFLNGVPELVVYVASIQSGLKFGDTFTTGEVIIPKSASVIFSSRKLE